MLRGQPPRDHQCPTGKQRQGQGQGPPQAQPVPHADEHLPISTLPVYYYTSEVCAKKIDVRRASCFSLLPQLLRVMSY